MISFSSKRGMDKNFTVESCSFSTRFIPSKTDVHPLGFSAAEPVAPPAAAPKGWGTQLMECWGSMPGIGDRIDGIGSSWTS